MSYAFTSIFRYDVLVQEHWSTTLYVPCTCTVYHKDGMNVFAFPLCSRIHQLRFRLDQVQKSIRVLGVHHNDVCAPVLHYHPLHDEAHCKRKERRDDVCIRLASADRQLRVGHVSVAKNIWHGGLSLVIPSVSEGTQYIDTSRSDSGLVENPSYLTILPDKL